MKDYYSTIRIEGIETVGEDDMYMATLGFAIHGACLTVIGATLDECVTRAVIVRRAFKEAGKVEDLT